MAVENIPFGALLPGLVGSPIQTMARLACGFLFARNRLAQARLLLNSGFAVRNRHYRLDAI